MTCSGFNESFEINNYTVLHDAGDENAAWLCYDMKIKSR